MDKSSAIEGAVALAAELRTLAREGGLRTWWLRGRELLPVVQGGMGVGVFAPAVLRRELAEGQLRLLGVSGAPLPDLSFTASWRRGRDSHVAAAVARLAVQVAGGAVTDSKF